MALLDSLTPTENRSLASHEKIIEDGMGAFIEVGRSLMAIREDRLYRLTHKSFESYCQDRWDIAKNYANKLITASKVNSVLCEDRQEVGTMVPTSERQFRPLAKLLDKGDGEVAKCWAAVVETAPVKEDGTPNVTAKHVEETVSNWGKEDASFDFGGDAELDSEPEEELEPMKDDHGRVIPPKLEEVFTDGPPTIKELMNRVSKLNKDIKDAAGDIEGCSIIPITATDIALKDCRTALKSAIPTWICVCNGRGCKKCDSRGWLQKQCGVLFDEVEA